jgi:hypothetical protein
MEAAETGAWSVPEADLLRLLATSRELSVPWLNAELFGSDGTRLPRPDGWLDDVALALKSTPSATTPDLRIGTAR